MAKNNLPAEKYAKPHTMSGKGIDAEASVVKKGNQMNDMRPSVANVFKSQPGTKTDGIKIRGTGAATKGLKARGPMG